MSTCHKIVELQVKTFPIYPGVISLSDTIILLAGVELICFVEAHRRLCFGFLMQTVVLTGVLVGAEQGSQRAKDSPTPCAAQPVRGLGCTRGC